MRLPLVLHIALLSCRHNDPWGEFPTACASSAPNIGTIETYVIEGKTRGFQFRTAPDVISGSVLHERQGRLIPDRNEIGVVEVVATERPSEASVELAYTQTLTDGGQRQVRDVFRCYPLVGKIELSQYLSP